MNKFIFSGNLGKDSELTFTPNAGKAILKFSVAVARGFKREDGTDWISCKVFGDRAEKLSAYLVKGSKVLCEGTLRINEHEGKYYTEVLINNLEFIGVKVEAERKEENTGITPINDMDDSEIPF